MRALGATPDGRSATVAAMTRLAAYRHGRQHTTTVVRLVFGGATAAVATRHAIHDAVEAADPSTSDPLHALIVGLEKRMWMLAAQLGVMWHLHGDRLSSADEANWTLLRPNRSARYPRSKGVFRGPETDT
jgi:hypothetical protein